MNSTVEFSTWRRKGWIACWLWMIGELRYAEIPRQQNSLACWVKASTISCHQRCYCEDRQHVNSYHADCKHIDVIFSVTIYHLPRWPVWPSVHRLVLKAFFLFMSKRTASHKLLQSVAQKSCASVDSILKAAYSLSSAESCLLSDSNNARGAGGVRIFATTSNVQSRKWPQQHDRNYSERLYFWSAIRVSHSASWKVWTATSRRYQVITPVLYKGSSLWAQWLSIVHANQRKCQDVWSSLDKLTVTLKCTQHARVLNYVASGATAQLHNGRNRHGK